MINILFSLLPFSFIIYYTLMVRKTKFISSELKSGQRCYSCKEKLEIDQDSLMRILIDNKDNYQLCKSCQRDEKLDGLINKNSLSRLNKIKMFIIDSRFDKFVKYLIFSIVLLLVLNISIQIFFNIKWPTYLYNIYLSIYWVIMIYRHKVISIKKPSE